MQYVLLSDNSYIVQLSTHMEVIEPKRFYFRKIKKLIDTGADEASILPLLKIPPLPNGVFEAYEFPEDGQLLYLHIDLAGVRTVRDLNSHKEVHLSSEAESKLYQNFAGVYASIEELQDDWPEYLF